jgi:hypothetical protein
MKHFSDKEFECKCGCGLNNLKKEVKDILEDVRNHFNMPCLIHSATRCIVHNKNIGGVSSSLHLWGNAVDLHIKNIDMHKVYKYLDNKYSNTYGIGLYDDFIHIDIRKIKTRWNKQIQKKEEQMEDFFKNIDFQMVGNAITTINPVAGLVVKSIDAIVNSSNENVSDKSVLNILQSISNDTTNKVDDKLICMVKSYLECNK